MTEPANEAQYTPSVRDLQLLAQDWRAAGVTHLPVVDISPSAPPGGSVVDTPMGTPADEDSSDDVSPTVPLEAPIGPTGSDMTPEQKSDKLQELAAEVARCTRCRELAETRTQTVFGVGNPDARILFVGEAPGADEDKQGEPFVGRAGQLLNKIIEACRLRREDVYICNILRCRPPGNRNPTEQEASNCREYLDGQIGIVGPEYIVCWGSVAAKNLLGTDSPIGRMRGRFYEFAGAKVLCTYHPSYLLRNPAAKKDVWNDMQFLFRDMGVDLTT